MKVVVLVQLSGAGESTISVHLNPFSAQKALYDYAEQSLDQPSIVYIRGFIGQRLVMSQDDAVRNRPSLDGKILYAKDMGPQKNQELQDYFPEPPNCLVALS